MFKISIFSLTGPLPHDLMFRQFLPFTDTLHLHFTQTIFFTLLGPLPHDRGNEPSDPPLIGHVSLL